jgi:hypothetical protein
MRALRARPKHRFKQPLCLTLTFLREHDGLGLTDGVGNESLPVKALHRIPIEGLPYSVAVVQAQQQKRENGSIDPISIRFHDFVTVHPQLPTIRSIGATRIKIKSPIEGRELKR